jgi:hypothetical protein
VKGKQAITSIWDWLGRGSMGEEYEVLPVVQPVVDVPPFEFPPAIGSYSSSTAIVAAGTITINLPMPSAQDMIRLWLHIWFNRSVADNDLTQLRRGAVGTQCLLFQSKMFDAFGTYDARFIPMIGGIYSYNQNRVDAPAHPVGISPKASYRGSLLSITHAAPALAVGNFNVAACYVDVPQSAPLPLDCL